MIDVEQKKIYLNKPQYMFELVQANTTVLIWGRRTGKTNYPMARFILNNVLKMPQSNGFIIANTYEQMLTRTLPPLLEGFNRLGWHENVHYWIGKFAPDKLHLPKSARAPLKPQHYIQFLNGSGIFMVSQDVVASINGVASQWGAGDEAKFLNKEKLDNEALLTFSGMPQYSGLSNYLSLFFSTDMPRDQKGKWLFDYEELMDKKLINTIAALQMQVHKLTSDFMQQSKREQKRRAMEIADMEIALNAMRKQAVHYSEASTLDNIHVLGLEPIRQFKRTLKDIDFQTTVLNRRRRGSGQGFYSYLDFDKHGYESPNYSFIENIPLIYHAPPAKDCRWDGDIITNKALSIACDYNASINCIVTGQFNEHSDSIRLLSAKYVLNPKKIEHLAKEWHEYYKYHPVKEVIYYYDVTAEWEKADDSLPYSETWYNELTKLGWDVTMIDIGAVPSHNSRYIEWNKLFLHQEENYPLFEFNKSNAYDWYVSASECGAKDTGKGIEKNKLPEKDLTYPQEEAPHMSDAGDILMWGLMSDLVYSNAAYIPPM